MAPSELLQIPDPDASGADTDTLATQEQKQWIDYDDLNNAKRNNTIVVHKTIGWLIPIALVFSFLMFLMLGAVYAAHLVLPDRCTATMGWCDWLSQNELQQIHSIIFSSVVGGAIALVAKTYFSEHSAKKD